ncbi:NAD-dependent epimerase/dehydratase family protein (plasmid) [Streptomyces atratus]|uniref:Nucleoside-diphosphate-sugar epimerase n=1 Tax=Streptomyces atratus TaxID=1893 RepID=A0A1K1ZS96_STRAR|nr:NAD-dependent epimerase/dehydratase family protein [Streptomyces atratus]SFX76936.1 Nucleoside-diphosphate-sugar epimerase [Streptomyces atratus]
MTDSPALPLVVVLGASGLLGTAVTRELAGRRLRLRLVGRRPVTVPERHRAEVEVRRIDLTTPGAVAEAVEGADAVVHLVAHVAGAATWRVSSNDALAERVNLGLLLDVIDSLTAQRRTEPPVVIFAGSMSQTGKFTSERITESTPDRPLTTYDRQKMDAELALKAATAEGALRGTTLRLATLFGQGRAARALDKGLVSVMMRRALAGQPLTMWHDGSITRDLVCIEDTARAVVAALDHADRLTGRHWLVGTGRATTIGELFAGIARAVSEATGQPPVPVTSVPPPDQSSPTDFLDFVIDPSAFQEASGWRPRIRWEDAVARTAAELALTPPGQP